MFADAGSVTGQGVLNPFPRFKMVLNGTAVLKTLPTGLFLLASWVAKTLQLGCKISPARVAKIPWLSFFCYFTAIFTLSLPILATTMVPCLAENETLPSIDFAVPRAFPSRA